MYVQFSFYYGLQSLGYQQQMNRVTTPQEHHLYNERLDLHNSTPTKKRNQSSIDTNLSTGTRPVSSATRLQSHLLMSFIVQSKP
jgi:outer membrane receptor for monomeric catechols